MRALTGCGDGTVRRSSIHLSTSCAGSTGAAHVGEWRAGQIFQFDLEAVIVLCVVVAGVVDDVAAHWELISTAQKL